MQSMASGRMKPTVVWVCEPDIQQDHTLVYWQVDLWSQGDSLPCLGVSII
jgi:hypothetical protein